MSTSICAIQHHPCETPGRIINALMAARLTIHHIHAFRNEPIPRSTKRFAALLIMGGPQSVTDLDKHPYLRDELRLIESALNDKKPILGICLGSQLLATALGTKVYPAKQPEIGWHPVTLTDEASHDPLWNGIPSPFTAYHWHGDVFDLPKDATSLASSEATACQAFRHGSRAYGFLFHMEITPVIVSDMMRNFGPELNHPKPSDDTEEAEDSLRPIRSGVRRHLAALHETGDLVFQRWTELVKLA